MKTNPTNALLRQWIQRRDSASDWHTRRYYYEKIENSRKQLVEMDDGRKTIMQEGLYD
ncbi:hypothetical protein [Tuberibacillus sp. Marseille-P3662]|uniref:hypothetical protein n=1 Tax=Tuberibacillus sp. Marseille-P3662 TaxID=1965358 RepID=UPI0015947893|nr:hypothetical protein [Tuberibacillus sp. Marseille-P3662]